MKLITGFYPLSTYKREYLKGDITAAIIVAILFIPQSMAYAMIAGVPPVIGLYAGTFPLLIYALFGSSKYLSVGPVSIVSLLAFTGVSEITNSDSLYFLELIITLGLMVGLIHLLLCILNAGWLFNYISHSVIGGFTSAVAIIIALNQVEYILGVNLAPYHDLYAFFKEIGDKLSLINTTSLTMGVGSILLLLLLKKYLKLAIGPVLVIAISSILVAYYQLNETGLSIVGNIPSGLPSFGVPYASVNDLKQLLPTAIVIAFISFIESFAIAKAIAAKEGSTINTNKELVGLGLANITSSFSGTIPVAGAFSRTVVNYHSGAKTKLSLLFTACFILITLLFFTDFFYYLPKCILAAIIIMAVSNLIDFKQLHFLVKTSPLEAFIFLGTFIGTLLVDVFVGLVVGILLSIILSVTRKVIFKMAYDNSK